MIEFLFLVVIERASCDFNMIGVFIVNTNKSKCCQQKTEKTTHVRDEIVDFPVWSCYLSWERRLSDVKLYIFSSSDFIRLCFCSIKSQNARFFDVILIWEETLVSINFILWNKKIGTDTIFFTEKKIVCIIKKSLIGCLIAWVDHCVYVIKIEREWLMLL